MVKRFVTLSTLLLFLEFPLILFPPALIWATQVKEETPVSLERPPSQSLRTGDTPAGLDPGTTVKGLGAGSPSGQGQSPLQDQQQADHAKIVACNAEIDRANAANQARMNKIVELMQRDPMAAAEYSAETDCVVPVCSGIPGYQPSPVTPIPATPAMPTIPAPTDT